MRRQKFFIFFLIFTSYLVNFHLVFTQEEKPLEFETPYAAELVEELVEIKEKEGVQVFQEKLEDLIVSVFPSLSPPVITDVRIDNITTNSATILWRTNVKSNSIVAYVPEFLYDPNKENPFLMEVGNVEERVTDHRVELLNLSPGTRYYFQVKSSSVIGVVGKSKTFTFATQASKIKLEVTKITNNEIEVRWITPVETDSHVEYRNLNTGKTAKVEDSTMVKSHVVLIGNLNPNTPYLIKGFGYTTSNVLIESDPITVKTKIDLIPPKITNIRIDNALFPGRTDRVLTVVSWKTDEPANSLVYYEEGIGFSRPTKNVAGKEDEYVIDHNVILVTKTGTIYRVQISSTDEVGNEAQSSVRTILTPRQEESILDIIIKNFEENFKFLRR